MEFQIQYKKMQVFDTKWKPLEFDFKTIISFLNQSIPHDTDQVK